jgi:UDP:flavonoid glycosyltransferase YjiC (YdhE family)
VHGKPMILVPIPDQTEQYGNARRAKSLGVAQILDQNNLNHDTLKASIKEVLGDRHYSEHAIEIMKIASSMRAVDVACSEISKLAEAV